MAPFKGRKSSANKNLPILSHEFVIQNHADIVSCVAMVLVIGLMVQVSTTLPAIRIYRSTCNCFIFVVYSSRRRCLRCLSPCNMAIPMNTIRILSNRTVRVRKICAQSFSIFSSALYSTPSFKNTSLM